MATQVAEISDVQLLHGQQLLNVFHYVDPTGLLTIGGLAADYIDHVLPLVTVLQHPDLTHVAIRYRQVAPTATLIQELGVEPPDPGDRTSTDVLPSSTAISVKFNPTTTVVLTGGFTGHIKRSGCRIGGVTEDEIDGDALVSGIATEVATWFAQLVSPNSDGWQLCVASYLNGARVRQPTVQAYSIIDTQTNPAPSTQNSRKVLRGRTF